MRRDIKAYGRTQVGQVVRYVRPSILSPLFADDRISVRSVLTVIRLETGETGAIVTLESGTERYRFCIDAYGCEWGGFGSLEVVQSASYQVALL
ncbi:hypothetical protein [Variovorax saccharolyticus]|uniref:hypothetical protein n=1 Tax=Variovorax saccharolyticus TaxID=3053516 RepID=UPI0025786225|nr:hypothetical protein [Variovorax sp. J31P216]MDM0027773.1 hypothetical protein [Variovorax sp. J31P216]